MTAKSLAILALLATASPVAAEEFMRADCRPLAHSSDKLTYDTPEQKLWYRRFWTGECKGLPIRCMPGSPNWNDVVGKLLAKTAAADRPTVLAKACKMGQTMGHEWSRERDVRRIDTRDLGRFVKVLNAAPDVRAGLDEVDQQVRGRLAR